MKRGTSLETISGVIFWNHCLVWIREVWNIWSTAWKLSQLMTFNYYSFPQKKIIIGIIFYLERRRTHVDLNTSPMILHGLTGRFAFKKMLKKPAVHSQRGAYHTHLTLYCQSTAHSDTRKLTTFLMTGLVYQYLGHLRMTESMWTWWSQMRQWKVPKGELEIIKLSSPNGICYFTMIQSLNWELNCFWLVRIA